MSTTVPKRSTIPTQAAAPPGEHRPDPAPARPPTAAAAGSTPAREGRALAVRDAVVAGGAALGGLLVTVGFAISPSRAETESADVVAAVAGAPERFYASSLIAAVGLAMLSCVGLAVLRLVQGRGRALATAGGLLVALGATAAAAGIFMYGAVISVLAEAEPLESATRLDGLLGDSLRTGLPFVVGFPAFFLGMVLCALALLRSRAVPRAVPALLLAGAVAIVALPGTSPVLGSMADLVLAAGCAAVAVAFWQHRTARPEPRTIVLPD